MTTREAAAYAVIRIAEGFFIIGEYGRVYFADRHIADLVELAIENEGGKLIYVLGAA